MVINLILVIYTAYNWSGISPKPIFLVGVISEALDDAHLKNCSHKSANVKSKQSDLSACAKSAARCAAFHQQHSTFFTSFYYYPYAPFAPGGSNSPSRFFLSSDFFLVCRILLSALRLNPQRVLLAFCKASWLTEWESMLATYCGYGEEEKSESAGEASVGDKKKRTWGAHGFINVQVTCCPAFSSLIHPQMQSKHEARYKLP